MILLLCSWAVRSNPFGHVKRLPRASTYVLSEKKAGVAEHPKV